MADEVDEILSLWREAEQLLDELPEHAPERVFISVELVNLKRIHAQLADEADVSGHVLASARSTIADARLLLANARARHERRGVE